MAKKGGVQQLQADINTDEEFEKFLERNGLLGWMPGLQELYFENSEVIVFSVLDVYSEWCGPCLGMVGSLKKIKLELGGDNLHLAICKSDTISYLKRFNKKSEPTWLFITRGKAVNLMFGTNVPKLIRTIANELELLNSQEPRPVYEITELQPEEQERQRVKELVKEHAERLERLEEEKQRRAYLILVTDIIMENLPDYGVTIFGPQVNRDMFKKIMEPADVLKIQCKDRRVMTVTQEQFQTILFDCPQPLSADVMEQMDKKELLICFWKVPDEQSVTEMLESLAVELTKPRKDSNNENERPPIIAPLELEVKFEIKDEHQSCDKVETKEAPPEQEPLTEYDNFDEKLEEVEDTHPLTEIDELDLEAKPENEAKSEQSVEQENEVEKSEVAPAKRMGVKTVCIPPIWTPSDQRTHAAMIYVFFRPQTAAFLPPDPTPEPPHVVMAFDAYKKKDLIELAERFKQDVPLYGFFTNDNPNEAKFIANSVAKYALHQHLPTDKLVFKVNKNTPDAMLAFAVYGPSFVSANTVIGKEEALKFFPKGYKTAEQEQLEAERSAAQLVKKKRKSKKGAQAEDAEAVPETAAAAGEESATQNAEEEITSSGEDSNGSAVDEEDDGGAEQQTDAAG